MTLTSVSRTLGVGLLAASTLVGCKEQSPNSKDAAAEALTTPSTPQMPTVPRIAEFVVGDIESAKISQKGDRCTASVIAIGSSERYSFDIDFSGQYLATPSNYVEQLTKGALLKVPVRLMPGTDPHEPFARTDLFNAQRVGIVPVQDLELVKLHNGPVGDVSSLKRGEFVFWQNARDGVLGGQVLHVDSSAIHFLDPICSIRSDGVFVSGNLKEWHFSSGGEGFFTDIESARAAHDAAIKPLHHE